MMCSVSFSFFCLFHRRAILGTQRSYSCRVFNDPVVFVMMCGVFFSFFVSPEGNFRYTTIFFEHRMNESKQRIESMNRNISGEAILGTQRYLKRSVERIFKRSFKKSRLKKLEKKLYKKL